MVYIASPLRGNYNTNIKNAVEYCRLAGERGVLPLAPHIIFSQWCNDTVPQQREQGLQLGLALLEKSDELWIMGEKISEGMRGEISFAMEHGIPAYHITNPLEPEAYPVSADENRLLSKFDCIPESSRRNYEKQLVVLRHENLKPEFRIPRNQVWLVTHDPGCRPGYIHSDTIHLRHPVDGDYMAVGRGDVWGVPKSEIMDYIRQAYPEFDAAMQSAAEPDGELCR
ncbi:hypothetical protein QA584_08740 [Anaerocolumna sp. AGMB13025]|uniref:DUF7768 domain-containing protein n=1 Tax=Anaerocolumna sp. AGMB13025 TaxID=3039116 RepID=UPI00241CCB07|nr:DUF4406 domain-containing protein [Anaerocolumna sp. AGMB13025]WFR60161.1 hypothetical protein QA584_08740 [Anaerocolumna sp. AGMB13025]